jgi:alpha-tubulin suppressor-like RCC1 family protein
MTNQIVNVKNIYPGHKSYVALREDGTAVPWGMALYGGAGMSFKGQLTFKSQTETDYEARTMSSHNYISQATPS